MSNHQPYTYGILSRCCGKEVRKGDSILCHADRRILYAWPGFPDHFASVIEEELNGEIQERENVFVVLDHMCPPRDQAQCDYRNQIKRWCDAKGLFCAEAGGIGHYLAVEQGWVQPGMLATHFDPHVAAVGAIGALGIGTSIEMIVSLVTGKIWMDAPPLYRIELTGALAPGVMGRDLLHYLVDRLGTLLFNGAVLEFYCNDSSGMTLDDKMVVCNLINYLGAFSALFVPPGQPRGGDDFYEDVISVDLSALEPYLGCPPAANHPAPLAGFLGTKVDLAIIGTCAGGGIHDIAAAAGILRGQRISAGVRLYVCPSTDQVFSQAVAQGYIGDLIQAGAFLSSPTCDFCYGRAVYLEKGQRAISTQTLNVPGRLGHPDTEIFLGSAATVAAAALCGEITDPRKLYEKGGV